MPMLDMPLCDLRQYQGRNPRPADIDAFWDASVAEMAALGTDCAISSTFTETLAVSCPGWSSWVLLPYLHPESP